MEKKHVMRIVLILTLVMLLAGCGFAIYSNRFDETVQMTRYKKGTDTHIDTLINIGGYYAGTPDDSTYRDHLNTFILYKDGTYRPFQLFEEYFFLKKKNVNIDSRHIYNQWPMPKGGRYVIAGDTVIVDSYHLRKSRWRLDRLKFKVISRDTLMLFERETDLRAKGRKKSQRQDYHQFYVFVPAKLPPVDNWGIIRKKWMWEDEEEWRHWIDSVKVEEGWDSNHLSAPHTKNEDNNKQNDSKNEN